MEKKNKIPHLTDAEYEAYLKKLLQNETPDA